MSHSPSSPRSARATGAALSAATSALFVGLSAPALAQDPTPGTPTLEDLLRRVAEQDRRIEALEARDVLAPNPGITEVGYKRGYFIRSTDPNSPFELRINGRMQFRFVGFDPDTGSSQQNPQRDDFEIERGRLEFRGTWVDPRTHFYINLDADTDDNHQVIFHDFWVNHEFSDAFDVYVGKAFVPGSRDWLAGSTSTHLIDRSMATSFFRPDRSLGVWVIGEPIEDVHYRVMVGNGFNTSDLAPGEVDSRFTYAASIWAEPLTEYGGGYADLQDHRELAVLAGASFTYSPEQNGQAPANAEADAIRYSDGRRLTADGVDSFSVFLTAADLALKYRGFAANAELFFRQLDQIHSTTQPMLPRSIHDWGGYCDVGYMVLSKSFEVVARVSTVQGDRQDSWEYAGGCNWYLDGTHQNKLSFDASLLDGSPVSNSGTNYRVGDDGWLFRMQWQIAF